MCEVCKEIKTPREVIGEALCSKNAGLK